MPPSVDARGAEIHHLGRARLRDDDILRLDIAVVDSEPVHEVNCLGDLNEEIERLAYGEGAMHPDQIL